MQILRLTISNFMAIGEATVGLDNRGLVLIQGENKDDSSADSNGSGKSSLADALSWGLFGVTARGESAQNIVNRNASRATVRVVIEDSGSTYEIVRSRNKKTVELAVREIDSHGKTISDLTAGTTKASQEIIGGLLGCSPEIFNAAIYAGQDQMPDLPGMTDKNLKELVEQAAGVKILGQCHEEAKSRAGELRRVVGTREFNIEKATELMRAYEIALEEAENRIKKWDATRQVELKALQDQAKTQSSLALAAREAFEEAEKTRLDLLKKQTALKAQIDGVAGEKARLLGLDTKVLNTSQELAAKQATLKALVSEAKDRKLALETVDARVGAKCGECGKEITADDLDHAKNHALTALKNAVDAAQNAKREATEALSERDTATKARDAYAGRMTDVSEAVNALESVQGQIARIDQMGRDADREVERLTNIQDRWDSISMAENPHSGETDVAEKRLAKQREGYEAQLIKQAEEVAQFERAVAVADLFSPSGVRAHIMDTVTPFLNARTDHYLSMLSDSNIKATWNTLHRTRSGNVREKFTIEVKSATGGETFKLLSGGEKRKVRLACAMALQDVVAARALKPIRLFVADEIDDALDDAGLERLMTLLSDKAKDRGTVLVISHNELSDWIREVATVTKEGGLASISGALDI